MPTSYQSYCPSGCPSGCDYTLPTLPSTSCSSPAIDVIDGLFIIDLSVPLVQPFYLPNGTINPAAVTEFSGRLSNTSSTNSSIRYIKIYEGTMASSNTEFVESNDGSKAIFRQKQEIKFTDHDDSDTKYSFWSKIGCINGKVGVIPVSGIKWYADERLIKGSLTATHKIGRNGTEPTRSWEVVFDYIQTCASPRINAIL